MSRQKMWSLLIFELFFVFVFALITFGFVNISQAWEIDLSRRRKDMGSAEKKADGVPSEVGTVEDMINKVTGNYDRQEFVILNTANGFVPSSVRVRKGSHYLVHVVNVNEDKKNVSFMLDAFAQNHATFYGKLKSFALDPNKEGVFTFQCPETSSEGRLIVFSSGGASPVNRGLSSDSE